MEEGTHKSQKDWEWENRRLCSDESCIGVIGPDGNCKECGKPYKGDEPFVPFQTEADESDDSYADEFEEDSAMEPEAEDEDEVDTETQSQEDLDWDNRILCSDESCIGVIGPDGNCKECGKPYQGK
jgi:hypothetical protein